MYFRESLSVITGHTTYVCVNGDPIITITGNVAAEVTNATALAAVIRVLESRDQLIDRDHFASQWVMGLGRSTITRIDIEDDKPIVAHGNGGSFQLDGMGTLCHTKNHNTHASHADKITMKKRIIIEGWDTKDFITFTRTDEQMKASSVRI